MPVLKDIREVKTLKLDKSGITLKIKDGLLAGDIEGIQKETDTAKQSLMVLAKLIVEWDATDDKGTALAVNVNNLKLLPVEDVANIKNALGFVQDFLATADASENSESSPEPAG